MVLALTAALRVVFPSAGLITVGMLWMTGWSIATSVSPGKLLVNLVVAGGAANRIKRSLTRYATYVVLAALDLAVQVSIQFVPDPLGVALAVTGILVIATAVAAVITYLVSMWETGGHRAFHDWIAGTFVDVRVEHTGK